MATVIPEFKLDYSKRFNALLDKYRKIVFVGVDNVTSQQMHDVRKGLRGKAEIIMGKKTMQKKILRNRAEASGNANDVAMVKSFCDENLLKLNCGLIFTNEDLPFIKSVIEKNRINAPARVGSIAPVDVIVPAGNTGLEPTMTNFFQALNIPTKIAKGTVEIVNDQQVLKVGDKVDNSTAALLHKLKINPFFYQLEVWSVWEDGVLFTEEDLKLNDEVLSEVFNSGITNLTALSLGAGVPTEASFPHLLKDAFKDLLAISVETEYTFTEFNGAQLRSDIKSGKAAPAAAAPAAAAPAKAAAAKAAPPPKKEESEEEDFGSLF